MHPGGLQWLLRKAGRQPDFFVRQWWDGDALGGYVIADAGYVIVVSASESLDLYLGLLHLAEEALRREERTAIEVSVWDDDAELVSSLRSLGYAPSGTYGEELLCDTTDVDRHPELPEGSSMCWLEPGMDHAYVELHRAAWSTIAPSTYDDQAHAAVVKMPHFDRQLVPVVAAPDGTLAAYCIAWFDPLTRTSEIEPLGTRPEQRRLGLARAVAQEAVRRSAERGATSVLVWGVGAHRVRLYESAGFRSSRVGREYARSL